MRDKDAITRPQPPEPLLDLVRRCQTGEVAAERALYDRLAPRVFAVCLRYLRQHEDAEEALVEALFKVLTHLNSYTGEGNFEGWVRRITVNECLMMLRKRNDLVISIDHQTYPDIPDDDYPTALEHLAAADLLRLLDHLPNGCATVFKLYAVEGYKHREVAELLGISVNTSKSQLILAKTKLQALLNV